MVRNLAACMVIWAVIIMNYQINAYYDDSYEGDVYDDDIYMNVVELVGFIFGEFMYEYIKSNRFKKIFIACFIWTLIFSIGLIINDPEKNKVIDIALNYLCKFGIAVQFQVAYLIMDLFPVVFSSTTFGLCMFSGMVSAFTSVYVYVDETRFQYYLVIILCIVGIVASALIKDKKRIK